jgi:hypothetical protein
VLAYAAAESCRHQQKDGRNPGRLAVRHARTGPTLGERH